MPIPQLSSAKKCCFQLVFGGMQATTQNAQRVMAALRDLDVTAEPVMFTEVGDDGRRRMVIQDCSGQMSDILDLITIDENSRDHPNRKIFQPLKEAMAPFVSGLGPRYRCGCSNEFKR